MKTPNEMLRLVAPPDVPMHRIRLQSSRKHRYKAALGDGVRYNILFVLGERLSETQKNASEEESARKGKRI